MNIIDWIEKWFKSLCDGEWEHGYGIEIRTLDNPGWSVKIDLSGTKFESLLIENKLIERSENDWYLIEVKDSFFKGYGDPTKLNFILNAFKEIVETHSG